MYVTHERVNSAGRVGFVLLALILRDICTLLIDGEIFREEWKLTENVLKPF